MSQYFTDSTGKSWAIDIDDETLERIRIEAGVNLAWIAKIASDNSVKGLTRFGAILWDPDRMGSIMAVLLPDCKTWDAAGTKKATRAFILAMDDAFPQSNFQDVLGIWNRQVMEIEAGPFSAN